MWNVFAPKIAIAALVGSLVLGTGACTSIPALPQTIAGMTPTAIFTPTIVTATPVLPTLSARIDRTNTVPRQGASGQGLPAGLQALGLEAGVVVANNRDSLTLKSGKATSTFSVSSETIVAIPGQEKTEVGDIRLGDRVVAKLSERDKKAPASLIVVVPTGYTMDNLVLGTPTEKTARGVVLRTRNGSRTVTAAKSTLLIDLIGSQARIAAPTDIRRDSPLLIIGQPSGKSFTAQVVVILDKSAFRALAPRNVLPTPTVTP